MNLALPRSSHLLGAKLSGKATLLRVFMAAFHDIWDVTLEKYVLGTRPEWKKYWRYNTKEVQDEASLQADIDLILDAQQAWANKYARGRSFDHVDDWGDLYPMNISCAPQSYKQHVRQYSLGEVTFDARACFEADYDRAVACRISPQVFEFAHYYEMPDLTPPVVPVNLITGPWNEEQKRRLFWLVRAKLLYDCHNEKLHPLFLDSRDPQVKLACLDAAVVFAEKLDPLIITCLIGCDWLLVDLPLDAKQERLIKICSRIDRGGEMLDMQILRFLVRKLVGWY
ncbi:hypothetical protein E4U13_001403 [Claviceps humidiphila]|uniref:Uncharacterized protein n=1 Tax=Claviceps humidiphila TaxID=1294629 RepID=A0A9P7Q2X1_9HYPO|nr:hypothetical protein E4U13_001403 [Claviceps humidiphila]